jgi:cytochrome c5
MTALIRWTGLLIALAGLAACEQGGDAPAAPAAKPDERAVLPTWREERAVLGKETYAAACASCHDSGEGGAPRIGVREDWADRSNMWQAVLARHAKSGYLSMPEKGGAYELSDESVDAAVEFMMGQTFPELPRD